MQQKKLLHKKYYYLSRIDERDYSKIVWERKEKLELFDKLLSEGCSEETALEAIKTSRSTYYRWKQRYKDDGLAGLEDESKQPNNMRKPTWTHADEKKILEIRKKFPLWGKEKITIILKREYNIALSISMVGRIIHKLIKNSKIKPVSFYTGQYTPKRRIFNDHAQRLEVGMKSQKPGELVQIDHMSVKLDTGKEVKHFEAMCPSTRFSVSKAYREATALNAQDFLLFLIQKLPFKLISIQVDGGSEFRGEFEQACKKLHIPLFVTPVRSPQTNAFVERGNGIVKYEFYKLYNKKDNLETINDSLQQYKDFYNSYRPHRGLQGLTPVEYCKKVGVFHADFQSHMY